MQFGKGNTIDEGRLARISLAEEGTDINLLYEGHRGQSVDEYKKQLDIFVKKDYKRKAAAFEIESKSIDLKILEAINKGIKDFYLIAGMYKDIKRWRQQTEAIRRAKGRSTIVLLKRYDNKTKESYIIPMFQANSDNIVHGSPQCPPIKSDFDVVFLDSDGIYKMESKIVDSKILEAISNCSRDDFYCLSRALAINEGNNIVKSRELYPIVEE